MFNVTGGELFMILLVALIVLGPERLPAAARRVGQVMGQLRDLSEGFKREVSQALDDPGEPIVKPAGRPKLTALDGGGAAAAPPPGDPGAVASDPVAAAATTANVSPSSESVPTAESDQAAPADTAETPTEPGPPAATAPVPSPDASAMPASAAEARAGEQGDGGEGSTGS